MKQINELKLDEIPQWQKDAFVKAAIDKFKKNELYPIHLHEG